MSQTKPENTKPKAIVKKKSRQPYRYFVQAFFLVLVILITVNNATQDMGFSIPFIGAASLHAICPFGGVVSIYEFMTAGRFVQKIHESSFILMFAAIILAVGFGPLICGWVCPFGTVQEWFSKLGRKLFGKKYNHLIPVQADRYLRFIRYIILFLVVYMTAVNAKLIFQNVDPYYALFNFWSSEVSTIALAVLGVTAALSLFIERPWCKYACPYGALMGIFNVFRIFKIRRNSATCIDCGACDLNCPMNLNISTNQTVRDHQCISCMKCTSEQSCPIDDTVTFSVRGKAVKQVAVSAIVLVIIFGSIGITSALGLWQTSGGTGPARFDTGSGTVSDPADIRGSFTFGDIEQYFGVPLDDLGSAFGLKDPSSFASFKCKDLETIYGSLAEQGTEIGTDSVRHFVALYKELPFTLVDTTYLPAPAVEILKAKADLTAEQLQFIESHSVEIE